MESLGLNYIVEEDLKYIISENLAWKRLKDKTLLISGANGLLASYIVYTIIKLNDERDINCKIIGVVRNKQKALERFNDIIERKDFKLIVNDICDLNKIDEHIDYIIHAASQASPNYYKIDPVGTINANVLGTNNLLKIAYKNNIDSFLFISSGEVYGDLSENDINDGITETDFGYLDPVNIRSCYAEGKRLGETMCASWHSQYDIPCKIVRPFHTYGPGIRFDDGRVFSDFVANIINEQDIIIKSDGTAKRCFCYIADAVIAFFLILLQGENGQAYNVANDECEISIKELADILIKFSHKSKVIIDETKKDKKYMKSEIKSAKPNTMKIRALGWEPKVGIEEGFKRTIKSY